jgi:hypothetical protein
MTTLANHHVDPHLLVVLGATSDLMRRKLLPAIYRLRTGGAVPVPLIILGASRQAGLTDEGFRDLAAEALRLRACGRIPPAPGALWGRQPLWSGRTPLCYIGSPVIII